MGEATATPHEPARARRSLAPRLALAIGSLLAALTLAELALWILAPRGTPIGLEQFEDAVEQGHGANFERVFRWDHELLWRLAPDVKLPESERPFFGLVSNHQGLREDHSIGAPAPGELRILFLGDSVTFGYLVRHDEAYVDILERDLAARFPEHRIECINAGVPGYTLVQGLRFLEREGLAYHPHLVVLNFGWNCRAEWSGGGDLERLARRERSRVPSFLDWSRLAELSAEVVARVQGSAVGESEDSSRARVTPEEFHQELVRARALLDAEEIELLLLVGAGRFNLKLEDNSRTEYQIQQYLAARELHLGPGGRPALVDGVSTFRELAREHTIEEILFDGIHPTALGHRKLAEALVEVVEPWLRERLKGP